MSGTLRKGLKRVLRQAAAGVGWLAAQGGDRRDVQGDAVRAGSGDRQTHAQPEGPRILCYHGVCKDPPDEWSVTPAQLRAHMRLVREHGTPVPIGAVVDWVLLGAPLPPRAVSVSFDDGYIDVLVHAAPILAEAGVPGAAFIVTGLPGKGPQAADPSFAATRPLLDWAQVKELSRAGWTLGAHSRTHPVLSALPEDAARRELRESRDELEQRLSLPVDLLAYPYGTARTVSVRDHRLAAQVGYRAALLDMIGPLCAGTDPMTLPRSKVLGTDSLFVVGASLSGQMDLWRKVEARD